MRTSLKLARIGMTMDEATIVKWHKQAGDRFAPGDQLYEFETEKVTEVVEATAAGTLLAIVVAEGDTVAVGAIVCVVDLATPG